jgi:hypothetical protein
VGTINAERTSNLRRRVLPVFLGVISAALAGVLVRTVMPGAPAADTDGRPVGQASRSPAASASASTDPNASGSRQAQPNAEPSTTDMAVNCYVNAEGVRYRAKPNGMATSYGLARKGQAFVLEKYVAGGGNRWAFGDLKGARMDVYIPANRLNC